MLLPNVGGMGGIGAVAGTSGAGTTPLPMLLAAAMPGAKASSLPGPRLMAAFMVGPALAEKGDMGGSSEPCEGCWEEKLKTPSGDCVFCLLLMDVTVPPVGRADE